jgi:hypothetical protein
VLRNRESQTGAVSADTVPLAVTCGADTTKVPPQPLDCDSVDDLNRSVHDDEFVFRECVVSFDLVEPCPTIPAKKFG